MKPFQIKRTQNHVKKNKKYLSVFGEERKQLLENIIFSYRGTFILPRLQGKISEDYGVFAGTDCTEKIIRGLACCYPEKVGASFTLGLNEVVIK